MSNQQDIKLSEVFEQDSNVTLDENTRLSFAKQVLFWLILLCVSVFIAHGMYPDNKGVSDVFEFIKLVHYRWSHWLFLFTFRIANKD